MQRARGLLHYFCASYGPPRQIWLVLSGAEVWRKARERLYRLSYEQPVKSSRGAVEHPRHHKI